MHWWTATIATTIYYWSVVAMLASHPCDSSLTGILWCSAQRCSLALKFPSRFSPNTLAEDFLLPNTHVTDFLLPNTLVRDFLSPNTLAGCWRLSPRYQLINGFNDLSSIGFCRFACIYNLSAQSRRVLLIIRITLTIKKGQQGTRQTVSSHRIELTNKELGSSDSFQAAAWRSWSTRQETWVTRCCHCAAGPTPSTPPWHHVLELESF